MQRKARSTARVRRNVRLFDSLGQNVQPLEARTLMTAQLVADLNKDFSATLLYDGGQTQFYHQGTSIVATEGGESKTILTDDRLGYYGWAAKFQQVDQSVLIHLTDLSETNSVTNYFYNAGDPTATPLDSDNSEPLVVSRGHVFDFNASNKSLRELDLTTGTFSTIESPLADFSISKFVDVGNGRFITEISSGTQPNYYFSYNPDTREFTPITALDGQSPVTQIVPVAGKDQAFLLSGNNVFITDGTDAGTLQVYASSQKLARINAIGFGDGAILACSVEYFDWDNNVQVDREILLNVTTADPANPSVIFDSDRGGVDFPTGSQWWWDSRQTIFVESAGNVLCAFQTQMNSPHFYEIKADLSLVDLGSTLGNPTISPDGMGQFLLHDSQADELFHTSYNGLDSLGYTRGLLNWSFPDPLVVSAYQERFLFFSSHGYQQSYDTHAYGDYGVSLMSTDGTVGGTIELMAIESRLADLGYMEPGTNFYTLTSQGLVFQGWDAEHGSEPWISDGTIGGTHLLCDLVPGSASSDAKAFLANADGFSFIAHDAAGLVQQYQYTWQTSLAEPRATMLQIQDGLDGNFTVQQLGPDQFVFTNSGGRNSDFYLTDGTADGTKPFLKTKDRYPNLTVVNGIFYFTQRNNGITELWKGDGKTAPEFVAQLGTSAVAPRIRTANNNGQTLMLIDGGKTWISDGTAAGTRLIPGNRYDGYVVNFNADYAVSLQFVTIKGTDYYTLTSLNLTTGKTALLEKQQDLQVLARFNNQVFVTTAALDESMLAIKSTNGKNMIAYSLELEQDNDYVAKSGPDRILLYPTYNAVAATQPAWYSMNQGDSDFTEFHIGDLLQGGTVDYRNISNVGDYIYFKVIHDEAETPFSEIWRTDGTAAGTMRLVTGDLQPTDFKALQTGDTTFLRVNGSSGVLGFQVLPGGGLRSTELFDYDDYSFELIGVGGGKVLFMHNDNVHGRELFSLPIVQPIVIQPITNAAIDENQPWSLQATATGEEGPVRYSLVAGAEYGLTINPETGLISWTPTESAGGQTYQITVQATQADNPKVQKQASFSVQVNKTNSAPTLHAVSNQVLTEDKAWSLQAVAMDADTPTQTLTYSLEGSVPDGLTIDSATGQLQWTPTEAQGGLTATVTVKATDNGANPLTATQSFNIVVDEVNSAPELAPIADKDLTEGQAWSLQAIATDNDTPLQTLTYALEGNVPSGLVIDSKTGLLSWTTTEAQGGLATTVTVKVTDNAAQPLSATQSFRIFVNEVNNAPVVAAIASQSVKEGQTLSLNVTATDADLPTQKLTYKLVGTVPAGASIDPATGMFQWKPAYKAASNTFTVEVSDNAPTPAKTQIQFLVTVRPNPIAARFATVFNSRKQFTGLNVIFTDSVDAVSSQKLTSYKLVTAGRDKKFGTKDDVVVKLRSAKLQSDGKTILLSPSATLSKSQTYQLSALDTILDTYGRPLDGDNDGQFGGSAVTKITKGLIG